MFSTADQVLAGARMHAGRVVCSRCADDGQKGAAQAIHQDGDIGVCRSSL